MPVCTGSGEGPLSDNCLPAASSQDGQIESVSSLALSLASSKLLQKGPSRRG
ncbi:hypothetical protein I79_010211 [Cricetulus griseus]|uniref:Uncharacterized protein n=1 Tax=Cricetulus griseus TaxID=10029 RepID=G3HHV0_CRIGR|nr:hypothetical protein I79_010211 [Cricetulus griseus]